MNFRGFLVLLWAVVSVTAQAAAFDIDQLMSDLAQHKGGKARFVETRTMALLDRPLQSSGEMRYLPPDRLEKRTVEPFAETVVLDKDTLSVERDRRRMTIQVASRPEAQAFVESVRSTLSGNRRSLEKHYRLELQGARQDWSLVLLPVDTAVAALIKRITVTGQGNQVRRIEYLQADGDRSELSIEPITE